MDELNWSSVLYDDQNKHLSVMNQKWRTIPVAVLNLYSDRIHQLDLTDNQITTLSWIPIFQNLEVLILDNNQLTDAIFFSYMRSLDFKPNFKLKMLVLNKNYITDLNVLNALAESFPRLEYLSLHGNPICPDGLQIDKNKINYEIYRNHIISLFANLKFLDHEKIVRPMTGHVTTSKSRILKFTPRMILAKFIGTTEKNYHPLPKTSRQAGEHCGVVVGKSAVKYVGRNSEGNRYILNSDL